MLETDPLMILSSAGIFAFFKSANGSEKAFDPNAPLSKAMLRIASYTFRIYLVHFAVMECLDHYLGLSVLSYTPILSVPLNTILIFVLSLLISMLLGKIPWLRKMIQ